MALIEWTQKLSVGVPEMDEQHKKLVELINRLHEAMRKGEGPSVIKAVLNELVTYIKVHFAAEERMLASREYPGLAAQKRMHKVFTDKVAEMNQKVQSGAMLSSITVSSFLQDWLVNHIQNEDKKYERCCSPVPA